MLSRLRRRDSWGGRRWPDHTAGREGAAAGGQRGSRAASPGCCRPPRSTRDGTALGGRAHRLRFKGETGLPGPWLPGSGALRQPGSSGDPQHHPWHPPPTGPGPSSSASTEGLFLSPAFVFYLVLLFSLLWSFVPACPLFRRLWFLFPLMLCHSLHLGAFLSPGF